MLETSLSQFERLPRVLFVAICHYLPLEHKLSKLITLNHVINQSFSPVVCCRYDTVRLSLTHSDFQPHYAAINYMNIVRSIHITATGTVNSNVLAAIKHAVASPLLESLHVHQRTVETQRNLAMVVLDVLAGLDIDHPSNLKQLSLEIHDQYDRAGMNWSGLQRCTKLDSLSLALADGPYLGMQMLDFTQIFPSSLTHLRVSSTATSSELRYDVWKAAMANPDFLPHLNKLELVNSSGFNAAQLKNLSSTVMNATGVIRPIQSVKVFAADVLPDLSAFSHLTSISFRIQPEVIPLIASLPLDMRHQLRSFNVEISVSPNHRADTEIDFSPLLLAISHPEMRQVSLTVNVLEGGVVQPISKEAMHHLYDMRSLEHLEIVPLVLDSYNYVVPSNQCWPNLRSIKFALKNTTNACLDRLLTAAPALTVAKVDVLNENSALNQLTCVTFISVIALLGAHCKRVKAIDITMPDENIHPVVTRDQVLTSQVGEYLADASFSELLSLNVKSSSQLVDDQALHILLKKLSKSPRLTECSIGQKMSRLQTCMLSMLPNLSYLSHIPDESLYYALNRPKQSSAVAIEVETEDSDSDAEYDYDSYRESEVHESDNEQQEPDSEYLYLEDALLCSSPPFASKCFDDASLLSSAPSLRFSRAIRQRWNDSKQQAKPLCGREAFFECLFETLSENDRNTLNQFV